MNTTNGKLLTPWLLYRRSMLPRAFPFSFIPLWLLLCGIHTIFTRGNTINCDRARTNYIRIQWSRGTLHGTSDVNRIRHALYCISAEEIIAVWRLRFAFDIYSLLQRSINNRKIYKRHLILLYFDIRYNQNTMNYSRNTLEIPLFGKRLKEQHEIYSSPSVRNNIKEIIIAR